MRKLICFFLVGFLAVSFAADIRQRHSGCSKTDLSTRHACSVDDEGTLYVGYKCFDNVNTDDEFTAELRLVGYGAALRIHALTLQLEFGRSYAPAICVDFDFDDDVQYFYFDSDGEKAWIRNIQNQQEVYLESAQFKSEVSSRLKACSGWDTSHALADLNSL